MKKLFSKLHSKHKKGFTLLEMLVVVVIIGVLTAVAVPTYNRVMRQSRVADGLNMLDVLASAQNKYYIQHEHYTNDLSELNAPIKKSSMSEDRTQIFTTNFTYSKEEDKNCVYATSSDNGGYIIAKNYKTNAKPICHGNGCSDFSSLVETGNLEDVCPTVCEKSLQYCLDNHFTGYDEVNCKCTGLVTPPCEIGLADCLTQNCTGISNCQCTGCPNPVCKDGDERWIALAGKTCSPVTQGNTERDRGCGRLNIKQKCLGGVWVDTDEGVCSNQWLIDQCGSESNVNWSPKCDCKKDIVCKYKGADYNVGQPVYTGYEDDTDGSCKTTSSTSLNLGTTKTGGRKTSSNTTTYSTEIKCYMKHLKKVCQEDTTWQDDFDCVDKATICSLNGQVLDENCNCVDPQITTCDTQPKPACDGQILGGENPCGRGSSTSSGTGGASQYVPCEFLCAYNQQVAVCNEETGKWNTTCDTVKQTYNPNAPKYQPCQGEGAADSACGRKSLISVSCELQTPYNQLNFNVTENYGECTLPEGACWEGEERTNPDTNIPERCIGCTWVAQGCNPNATLPQQNVGACQMKDQECQQGIDGTYSWQYTNEVVLQPGAQCVDGQTETCYVGGGDPKAGGTGGGSGGGSGSQGGSTGGGGGNSGIPGTRFCSGCKWSECMTCSGTPPSTPSAKGCTYSVNGVQYCGGKEPHHAECDNSTGQWTWVYGMCSGGEPKPTENPSQMSPNECLRKGGTYQCKEYRPYQWTAEWGGWQPVETGNQCDDDLHSSQSLGSNTKFCKNCKWKQCPGTIYQDYVYNSTTKKCYYTGDQVYLHVFTEPKSAVQCSSGTNPRYEYCPSGAYFPNPPGSCPRSNYYCYGGARTDIEVVNWTWANDFCQKSDPTKIGIYAHTVPVEGEAIANMQWCTDSNHQSHRYCPVVKSGEAYICREVAPVPYTGT